jgi:xylulokinase
MRTLVIGIDIGTTGTKTILVDLEKGLIAQATRASALASRNAGWAEADPAQWIANVHESIGEVMSASGASPREVVAVSTSGMVPAVIPVDAGGRALRPAILQNDARAGEEIESLTTALRDLDLVSLTGSSITQQSVAPKAMWIQRHEPEVWEKTVHLVGSYDWVLMALGAEPHVEHNWAIESGMFEVAGKPLPRVLTAARVEASLLPPVLAPGSRAGTISPAAAAATGLSEETALIVGGADHVLSAFAAGVDRDGDWLVKLGGAGDILVASRSPIVDARLYLDAHPVPGHWLPNGCMATSGSLIRWFQTLIGGEDLVELDREAATRPPASVLALPYFLGEKSPLHDTDLRGAFVGLHLGHTRADLYRSILESIAFGFRHHVDIFREIGLALDRAMITNGGSKSRLWKQIHSEILGTELFPVVDHPGASLGAAIIAAIGVGAIDDWSGARRFLQLDDPVVPDPGNIALYDDLYAEWRQLSETLTPISHQIARRVRQ